MLRTTLTAALLLLGGLVSLNAQAAETAYRLSSDTAFILNLDLQAVRNSEVGGRLLGVVVDKAIEKIAAYRDEWRAAGHPGHGTVTLMLHTFVGSSDDEVRAIVWIISAIFLFRFFYLSGGH